MLGLARLLPPRVSLQSPPSASCRRRCQRHSWCLRAAASAARRCSPPSASCRRRCRRRSWSLWPAASPARRCSRQQPCRPRRLLQPTVMGWRRQARQQARQRCSRRGIRSPAQPRHLWRLHRRRRRKRRRRINISNSTAPPQRPRRQQQSGQQGKHSLRRQSQLQQRSQRQWAQGRPPCRCRLLLRPRPSSARCWARCCRRPPSSLSRSCRSACRPRQQRCCQAASLRQVGAWVGLAWPVFGTACSTQASYAVLHALIH